MKLTEGERDDDQRAFHKADQSGPILSQFLEPAIQRLGQSKDEEQFGQGTKTGVLNGQNKTDDRPEGPKRYLRANRGLLRCVKTWCRTMGIAIKPNPSIVIIMPSSQRPVGIKDCISPDFVQP